MGAAVGGSHSAVLPCDTLTRAPPRFFFPQKDKMVCGKPGAKWVQFGMKILDNRNKKDSKPHT